MRKITKVELIKADLESLEIDKPLSKEWLIITYWKHDYWNGLYDKFGNLNLKLIRSFDVAFLTARKQLPEKKFKTKGKIITRIL